MTQKIYDWYTTTLGLQATFEELESHNKLLRKVYRAISNPHSSHLSLGCYLFLRHTGLFKLYKRKFKRGIPWVKINKLSDHWLVSAEEITQVKDIVLRTLS